MRRRQRSQRHKTTNTDRQNRASHAQKNIRIAPPIRAPRRSKLPKRFARQVLSLFPRLIRTTDTIGASRPAPHIATEANVKRKRLTQIVLVIVGVVDLSMIYFLYLDLRHSSWLLVQKNECDPMFLSFFIPVGVFLLIAAKKPSAHRSMIALAAWWNISHSAVMAIQTVQARLHGVHRDFTDVILFLVIGLALLALLPPKQNALASRVA